jgi:hypothetical protein
MKRRGKRLGVGIGAAAAIGAIGLIAAVPASAHKVAFDTNLQLKLDKLNETTEQYSGKVTSNKGKCRIGRTVNVTQSGVFVASTVSNFAGDWLLTGPVPPKGATVTAFAPKKILKKNTKHRHKCKPAITSRRAPNN